jgi:4-amino-4-deoxy-L-arabinose transferase-like glycosyltransferase
MVTSAHRTGGVAIIIIACALLLIATIRLTGAPTVQWTLLLYPVAFLLGWWGECRLQGATLRALFRRLGAAVARHQTELLLLAVITGAGFALRLWMIGRYPLSHGLEADEIDVAVSAWNLVHGPDPWPLYQHATGSVSLFQPIGLSFLLFGSNLLSFRLPLVLSGTATIPAFYLLARQFARPPAALCAGLLLSLAFWPTMMGVLAFGWMYGAVFQSIGLALIVLAIRRDSLSAAAGGGAVLALCLYSYGAQRFMPIPAVVLLASFLVKGAQPKRQRLLTALAVLIGFAAVAAPWVSAVAHNAELLNGNAPIVTHDFQQSLHDQPFVALLNLLRPAGHLITTVLATPRTFGYQVVAVPSGGLLDGATACLVLLGVAYALPRFRRPENLIILCSIVISLGVAAAIQPYWIDTYRLNSAVPAIFLAVAVLLDRVFGGMVRGPTSRRWALTGLVALNVLSGVLNVHTINSRLSDCTSLTAGTELLSASSAEGLVIAESINKMGSGHAAFVVSASFQEWLWPWLYRVPSPPEYTPAGGDPRNPATWQVLYNPAPNASPNGTRFWPPRLGSGQTDLTYYIPDQTGVTGFLPIVRAWYPRGRIGYLQTAQCPSFKVTTYTLTTAQL